MIKRLETELLSNESLQENERKSIQEQIEKIKELQKNIPKNADELSSNRRGMREKRSGDKGDTLPEIPPASTGQGGIGGGMGMGMGMGMMGGQGMGGSMGGAGMGGGMGRSGMMGGMSGYGMGMGMPNVQFDLMQSAQEESSTMVIQIRFRDIPESGGSAQDIQDKAQIYIY